MTVEVKEKTARAMAPQQKQELTGAESTRPGLVFTPPMDVFETESAITVVADMPGVRPDGLSIDLRDNVLSIEARVDDVQDENERTLLQEYETGSFRREFRLTRKPSKALAASAAA